MKQPKNDSKYSWTQHAWEKMQFYGLSEGRVKRVIRFPKRIEEGIAEDTVAVMQPADSKKYQEIWVMYAIANNKESTINKKQKTDSTKKESSLDNINQFLGNSGKKFRIITAWRYPGESPERDPIPQEIMQEIRQLL